MSQIVTRKGPVGDDKEKVQSDSPVKDMKKKVAANAEKEKQAAEKHAEKDKDKDKDKTAEKHPEKGDKNAEKTAEKKDKADKSSDKKEKNVEKEKGDKGEKTDKVPEKKSEAPAEKPKEDKNAKPDKPEDKEKDKKSKAAPETPKPKQNGARANGLPAAEANGEHSDATVSSDEEMVIDHERDDMFPELAYEDSDGEFEPPTPEGLPSRSYTRRSQAKATRTPETPRPASDKRADAADDSQSKESKILKLKEDTPTTDRKLRSSDSPKPEAKKADKVEKVEKKGEKEKETAKEETKAAEKSPKKKDLEVPEAKEDGNVDKSAVDIVIDLEADEEPKSQEPRKADTNYSRSRVKVSPYRRSKADLTASSVMANYTGNNTTMEMDITESSSFVTEETPLMDSPYLLGLRSIRGRRSYKPLKEMTLRNISVNRSVHSTSTTSISVTEQPSRPTAPVVGRKRRPEGEEVVSAGQGAAHELEGRGKRARLLERLARPFRASATPASALSALSAAASTPLPARRNAEIVGINTDLPLTAPVAAPDTFDPESLKLTSTPLATPTLDSPGPLTPLPEQERDARAKCIVM